MSSPADTIRIRVLYFAALAERLGCSEEFIEVSPGAKVSDAIAQLHKRHPELVEQGSVAVAVNERYADASHELKSGDVVAMIPPISGG